jgi:predicted secreted protein
MKPQSMLAIYILFWTMSLFVVLPIGVRTPEEEGVDCPPGHAPSAPHRFSFGKAALRATIVSATAFALFYANYRFGWITIASLEWARPPGH